MLFHFIGIVMFMYCLVIHKFIYQLYEKIFFNIFFVIFSTLFLGLGRGGGERYKSLQEPYGTCWEGLFVLHSSG